MRKLMLVLFMLVVGCASNVKRPAEVRSTYDFNQQIPGTTVLVFNPTVVERKPAELPPPNHFPTKQVRPKKLN